MMDPCPTSPTTILMACLPKRKPSLNNGTPKKWMLPTVSSCDKRWKPTANQMSNSSKQVAGNSAKNSSRKLTLTPWRNASPSLLPVTDSGKETSTQEQDCLGTTSWMARIPVQPIPQSPEMVGMARTPTATATPCHGRSYPHCPKRRQSTCGGPVPCGRLRPLRSCHPPSHRVPIQRVSMAGVHKVLSSPT